MASVLFGCASDTTPEETIKTEAIPYTEPLTQIAPTNASSTNKKNQVISLQEAASLVVNYHPRVAMAISNARGEEEMIDVAKANYYPQIQGGVSYGYQNNSQENSSSVPKSVNVEVEQTLYDFGKTSSAVDSAEYGHQSAKVNVDATREKLIHEATHAVIESVRYQQLSQLAKAQAAQVESLVNLIEGREEKGASNLSDVLHVRARLDEVQFEELDFIAQHDTQIQNLSYLIGIPVTKGTTVKNFPKELDQACSMPIEWNNIPDYVIADIEAKRAITDLEAAAAAEMPTIYASGVLGYDLEKDRNPIYNSRADSRVAINFSMPIYQGGGLAAQKRASESRTQAAAARKEEIKLGISQVMSDSEIRLNSMISRQSLLEQRVENLKGTRDLYKKQYLDLGTRTLVDLLNSEQEFYRAQVEVANNQLNVIQTKIDCAFYNGKLDEFFNDAKNPLSGLPL